MATLHSYTTKEGFYVRHTFAADGKVLHVVYQTSEEALRRLRTHGISDGDTIPNGLLHEMINGGSLFTGKSGASSLKSELPREPLGDSEAYALLSPESRNWISILLMANPSVRFVGLTVHKDRSLEVEYSNIPENYFSQLIQVARRFDGTSFFQNLLLSHKNLPPNTVFDPKSANQSRSAKMEACPVCGERKVNVAEHIKAKHPNFPPGSAGEL